MNLPSYMTRDSIGTCSLCGGRVSIHSGSWHGIIPPTPSCDSCGATPANSHGPVIPMVPAPKQWVTTGAHTVITDGDATTFQKINIDQ